MADSNRGERSVDDEFDDEVSSDVDGSGDARSGEKSRRRSADASRPAGRSASKGDKRPGIHLRFVNFFREVIAELLKVIWPTRKELLTYTAVVVVFVAVVMTVVTLLDLGFAKAMFFVFGTKTNAN